jgi:hypothetical protein
MGQVQPWCWIVNVCGRRVWYVVWCLVREVSETRARASSHICLRPTCTHVWKLWRVKWNGARRLELEVAISLLYSSAKCLDRCLGVWLITNQKLCKLCSAQIAVLTTLLLGIACQFFLVFVRSVASLSSQWLSVNGQMRDETHNPESTAA